MSWPITITLATRRLFRAALFFGAATLPLFAQLQLKVPVSATAGSATQIAASGSGDATFYLIGPSLALKRSIHLGQDISLQPEELRSAGRYTAIACQESCQSADFFVAPAKVSYISLLAHPSRAAVGQPDALSGVALPFDAFHNLVLHPMTVDFRLAVNGQEIASRSIATENGVAWLRTNSGNRAGAVQMVASAGPVSTRRVIQLVASDPCHLQVRADRDAKGIVLETDPVRDCAGNPVPDGTMVTFRGTGPGGMSTVDAPIKQGVARARLIASGPVVISVASGVVMGNQVRVEAKR
jgi:hypothetical protein